MQLNIVCERVSFSFSLVLNRFHVSYIFLDIAIVFVFRKFDFILEGFKSILYRYPDRLSQV